MLCIGFLWNGIQKYKEECIEYIESKSELIFFKQIDLNNYYESFIRDIYKGDDIADWKVDKKIETMKLASESKSVTIVIMEIDDKEKEYHPFKKKYVSKNLEGLKREIREEYKTKVKHYFFDNVFHMSDNLEEFKHDYNIFLKYCNLLNTKLESEKLEAIKVKKKELRKGE